MNPESTASKLTPQAIVIIVLVSGSFAADSFLRFPIPGTNEPHYLTKAKYFWNPDWCSSDFFLESSNAHAFFYQVVGSFTKWLSLHKTAILGRLIGFLLLAIGWFRLTRVLIPGIWSPLISAWLYLGIAAIGNFSGEWIIGGIESKVFAYGFLFLSLANACEQRWNRCAIYAGVTISWHPVVGIWTILCCGFALLCDWVFHKSSQSNTTRRQKIKTASSSFGLLMLFSLPGLIPAVNLLLQGHSKDKFAANYIQVFYRIKHHLDPMDFHWNAYLMYAFLLVTWLILRQKERATFSCHFFQFFIMGTIGLACIGFLLGAGPRPASEMPFFAFRMSLLKFYPFRLFDAFLPLAVSISLINSIYQRFFEVELHETDSESGRIPHSSRKTIAVLLSLGLFTCVLYTAWIFPPIHKMPPEQRKDWLDACHWIKQRTPETALFLTPANESDFKWYAQRPEYVTVKDCPQDSSGVVEWNRRLKYLRKWGHDYYNDGFDNQALSTLKQNTNITHLLVKRLGPFTTMKPIYQNQTYKVYQLP